MSVTRSHRIEGHGVGGVAVSYSADSEVIIDADVADSVTDGLHALVLDVTQIKAIIIVSDKAVTLEFNDSGTGVPTIVLVANVPYIWSTSSYDTLLLTADVTALYITNASGSTARVRLYVLVDPTV